MRISKEEYLFDMTDIISKRSHDTQRKVGALLVNDAGSIISTGYNGFCRDSPDASLPTTRPEKYEYILHSEENLICNAANNGISMRDCTVVINLSPCKHCLRLLKNCGVKRILFNNRYSDFDEVLKLKDVHFKHTSEVYWNMLNKPVIYEIIEF